MTQRRQPRKRVDIDGHYNYANDWYPCKIYDLSVTGAGLKLNQFFVEGDIIRLKFGMKDDIRVIESIVANVNGQRIGVQFNVDPITRDFIEAVMHDARNRPMNRRY